VSLDLLAATIALAASYAVATSLNDVADLDIDRTHGLRDRSRPLVLGTAGPGDLRRTAGLGASVAAAAAVPLGAAGLGVIGLCLAVDFFYSAGPVRLSRRWTLAPVGLTIAYVALPYWLGIVVAHGSWSGVDVGLLLGLCILFFARIILKDIRDRLGDAAHGKPTALLRLGKSATCSVSVVGAVVGTAILVLAVAGPPAVSFVLVAAGTAIVWMLLRLCGTEEPALEQVAIGTAARAGNAMLITIIAWLLLLGQHATTTQVSAFVLALGAVFATSFLSLALHPERVRIAYKA
jgi:4-hydroxybenzoate polyprenyltransferase